MGAGGVLVGSDDVESTATTQSRSPSASAWASSAGKTFSQVPSEAHFRSRLWAPFHEPKCSGRSIHGVPVRYLNAIASITCR
jgi:hypothetical protein